MKKCTISESRKENLIMFSLKCTIPFWNEDYEFILKHGQCDLAGFISLLVKGCRIKLKKC